MTSPHTDLLDGAYTPRATHDDGESPYITTTTTPNNKKPKLITPNSSFNREEWSDVAISTLLDSYIEKCKLRFGNFRVRDWEEVAASVSEMCERAKSVDQCKNKVDNLKKRFKVERFRVGSGGDGDGEGESRWPWFRKMESIVGDGFVSVKGVSCDEKFGGGRAKRYATATSNPSGPITNMDKKPVTNTRWRRVVFKISGDALAGTDSENIDPKVAMLIAREVSIACHNGIEVAIIVGGRNMFYGDTWEEATNLDRSTSYQIGNDHQDLLGISLMSHFTIADANYSYVVID